MWKEQKNNRHSGKNYPHLSPEHLTSPCHVGQGVGGDLKKFQTPHLPPDHLTSPSHVGQGVGGDLKKFQTPHPTP